MIKLLSTHYYGGINYVVGQCSECKKLVTSEMVQPATLSCCTKDEFDKLPLHYLIHNKLDMVLFSLKHKKTGKELIGSTMEGGSSDYKGPIQREIANIAKNNIYPELAKQLNEEGFDAFKSKPLGFPNTLHQAMIQEKLYITTRKTLKPNGYNDVFVFEKVLKG